MSHKRTSKALSIGIAILLVLTLVVLCACNDKNDGNKTNTEFTVSFYVDGAVYQTISTTTGAITLPTNPTKEGYTFAGWYIDDGTFLTAFSADSVKANLKVYAKWTPAGETPGGDTPGGNDNPGGGDTPGGDTPGGDTPAKSSDVTLAITGFEMTGDAFAVELGNAVTTVDLTPIATVAAKSTIAVYSDEACTTSVEGAIALAEGNNTFYVKVTAEDGTAKTYVVTAYRKHLYTLTLDAGVGDAATLQVEEGSVVSAPGCSATKAGYVFAGWNYDFTAPVTASATVTAKWTAKRIAVKFDVDGIDDAEIVFGATDYAFAPAAKTGYTFGGWSYGGTAYTDATGQGVKAWDIDEAGVTLVAIWTAKTYDLTFENDVCDSIKVTYDAPMPAISYTPYKEGYLFDGLGVGGVKYYNADFTSAHVWDIDRNDVVMQELWVAGGYYVWLAPDNGEDAYKVALVYGENYTITPPTRTGYDFAGWYAGDDQLTDAEGNSLAPSSVKDSSWTFVAHWTAHVITVKFNANGSNTSVMPTTVTYGSTEFSFPAITRTGYVFGGWYVGDVQYASLVGAPMRQWDLDEETTLTAKWTPVVVTVHFDNNGGVDAAFDREATFDAALPALTVAPTRTGYQFYGYWTASALNEGTCVYGTNLAARTERSTYTEDLTLYAQWQPIQVTVSLRIDDESDPLGTATATYGEKMPDLDFAMPTKDGYVFTGFWTNGIKYYNADGTGAAIGYFTTAVNLYAQWKNGVYFVKFDANGATAGTMVDQEVECDVTATLDGNLYSKTGYTFAGWNTEADGTGNAYADEAEVKDLAANGGTFTLYAQWTANQYAVSFDANGGEGTQASTTATYDAAMPAIVVGVSRTGYTFGGYYLDDVKYYNADGSSAKAWDVSGSASLLAKWTANTTTVSFNANGGEGEQASVTATYATDMPAVTLGFVRTGYTFAGYFDAAEGGAKYYTSTGYSYHSWDKDAAAVTLYAQWTPNAYVITFNFNNATTGGTQSVSATYAAGMPPIPVLPTKTGYNFLGYFDAIEGGTQYYNADGSSAKAWDKAEGASLYAHWQVITTTVVFDVQGGVGEQADITATYGQPLPNLEEITVDRQYYRLAGWYTSPNGQGTQFYNGEGVSTGVIWTYTVNATLYAYWIDGYYTIHYNANCAEYYGSMSDRNARCNQNFNLNSLNLSRTGYDFVEWNTAADGSGTSYADGALIDTNLADDGETVTLYAIWQGKTYTSAAYPIYGEWDVTFDLNYENPDFDAPDVQHVTPATGLRYVRPSGDREGYYFAGWYTNPECTNYYYFYNTIYEDKTLYAKWVERTSVSYSAYTPIHRDGTYDITLTNADQSFAVYVVGDCYLEVSAGKNARIYISGNSYNYGSYYVYAYKGYTYAIQIRAYEDSEEYLGDTTFTVKMTPRADGRTKENTFATSVIYGSPVELGVPEAEGYTFRGWYSSENGQGYQYVDGEGNAVTNWNYDYNHAIYAYWIGNEYTVTLNDNGGTGGQGEVTATFGRMMPDLETVPTREDFDFMGYALEQSALDYTYYYNEGGNAYSGKLWNLMDGVTLYASWTAAPYKVIFDGNGSTGGSTETEQTHYRNQTKNLANVGFSKTGYSFVEWNTKADGSGTSYTNYQSVTNLASAHGEIRLYAIWSANSYTVTPDYNVKPSHTVTFDLNGWTEGEVPEAQVITPAQGLMLPTLVRDGYELCGWYDNAECTGEEYDMSVTHDDDVTLYAKWRVATYAGEEPLVYIDDEVEVTFDGTQSRADDATVLATCPLYAFVAPATMRVYFESFVSDGDTYGYLFNSEKVKVASDDDGAGNRNFRISYTVTAGAVYYVAVCPYSAGAEWATHLKVYAATGALHTSRTLAGESVTYDDDFTITVPEVTGYEFLGWYDQINGQGTQYTDETGASVRTWDKASDTTLYAYWQVGVYDVTFDANGGTGTQAKVEATFAEAMPAVTVALSRESYVFVGYFDAAEGGTKYYNADGTSAKAMDKGANTTLYAHWEGLPYTVAFDANGGEGEMDNQTVLHATATALTANAFTHTGYDFAGWNTKADGTGTSYADEAEVTDLAAVGETATLYAKWTAKTLTITKDGVKIHPVTISFNLNGATGVAPAAQTVTRWNALVYPDVPTYTGHVFAGWYDNAECTGDVFDFGTDFTAVQTVTLYAKWIDYTKDPESDEMTDKTMMGIPTMDGATSVTLDGMNVRLYPVVVLTEQEVAFTTYTSNKDTYGYLFDADLKQLASSDDGHMGTYGNAFYISRTLQAGTLYYVGVRAYSSGTETVTLTIIGGATLPKDGALSKATNLGTTTVTYGGATTIAADSLAGYTFEGWYDGEGGTGTKYVNADGTSAKVWDKAADSTLYAKWTAHTHTVTFDANGGTGSTPAVTATYGETMPIISTLPTMAIKIVTGYFTAADGGKKYYNGDMTAACEFDVDADLVLYAHWDYVPYYATFDGNGATAGSMDDEKLNRDVATVLTVNAFEKTGYDFMGWNTKADGSGTSYTDGEAVTNIADAYATITLYAVWQAKTTKVTLDDRPNRHSVTVTFDLNGGTGTVPDAQVVTPTVGITYPTEVPTKDGYLFKGWYEDAEGEDKFDFEDPIDDSITLYAGWFEQDGNLLVYGADNDITVTSSTVRYYFYVLQQGYRTFTVGKDAYFITSNSYYGNGSVSNVFFYEGCYYVDVHSKDNSDEAEYVGDTTINVGAVWPDDGGVSDNTVYAEFDIDYDEEVSFGTPTREHYDFMGWYTSTNGGGTKVTDNTGAGARNDAGTWDYLDATKTLYAYFRGVATTVTFDLQGGTSEDLETDTLYYDSAKSYSSGYIPTRTGYTFCGFYAGVGGTGTRYFAANMSYDARWDKWVDTIIYAYWTPNVYEVYLDDIDISTVTISFDLNGASGVAPAAQAVSGEDTLSYPAIPTRAGYIFAGWYDNAACTGTPFNFDGTLVAADTSVTLYAKWIAIPVGVEGAVNVGDATLVTVSGVTVRYYAFVPLTTGEYKFYSASALDMYGTLYLGDVEHLVVYNDDDDTYSLGVAQGGNNRDFGIVRSNLVVGNLYLIGVRAYSNDYNGDATLYVEGPASPDDGATTEAGSKATCLITFDDDTFALAVPVKAGYTFDGWYDGEGGTGTKYADETGAAVIAWDKEANTTLYAKWIEN